MARSRLASALARFLGAPRPSSLAPTGTRSGGGVVAEELYLVEAIAHLGITVIAVAHRLTTLRTADRIHVMSDGMIVERGTWDELLGANGVFAALMASSRPRRRPPSLGCLGAHSD